MSKQSVGIFTFIGSVLHHSMNFINTLLSAGNKVAQVADSHATALLAETELENAPVIEELEDRIAKRAKSRARSEQPIEA